MMKCKLVVIPFWFHKAVLNELGQMPPKLYRVEQFHLKVGFIETVNIPAYLSALSRASHKSWHDRGVLDHRISRQYTEDVIKDIPKQLHD